VLLYFVKSFEVSCSNRQQELSASQQRVTAFEELGECTITAQQAWGSSPAALAMLKDLESWCGREQPVPLSLLPKFFDIFLSGWS